MTKRRRLPFVITLALGLLATVLVACSRAATPPSATRVLPPEVSALLNARELELLSVQDQRDRRPGDPPALDRVDEFDVLGRIALDTGERRQSVVTELSDAIAKWDGRAVGCKPTYRHILREASSAGGSYLVICFQCGDLQVRSDGRAVSQHSMVPGQGAVANGVLDAQQVPHAR